MHFLVYLSPKNVSGGCKCHSLAPPARGVAEGRRGRSSTLGAYAFPCKILATYLPLAGSVPKSVSSSWTHL